MSNSEQSKKKHSKRSKWYFSFFVAGSTVITDIGVQIASAVSNHTDDVHVVRSLIVGILVGGFTRLIGMAVAAYVTAKEKEDLEDNADIPPESGPDTPTT